MNATVWQERSCDGLHEWRREISFGGAHLSWSRGPGNENSQQTTATTDPFPLKLGASLVKVAIAVGIRPIARI